MPIIENLENMQGYIKECKHQLFPTPEIVIDRLFLLNVSVYLAKVHARLFHTSLFCFPFSHLIHYEHCSFFQYCLRIPMSA